IIFVKTKKGEKGRPSIDFTAELINQDPIGMLEAVNGLTYATHYNEAMKYDGRDASSLYSDLYLNNYRNREGVNAEHYPDVDWMGDYFQNSSWVQRYNLGISGGSDRTRYFINGGLLTQKGMFNTDEEATYSTNNSTKLFNLRSNIEVDVTSSTTLNLDLYGWNDEQNRPGGSTIDIFDALTTTPANAFPAYYTDPGDFYTDQAGTVIKSTNGKIVAGNNLSANP